MKVINQNEKNLDLSPDSAEMPPWDMIWWKLDKLLGRLIHIKCIYSGPLNNMGVKGTDPHTAKNLLITFAP